MAYVMALQQGWGSQGMKFRGDIGLLHMPSDCRFILIIVNNDIRGLINSVNDGTTSAFMWEWFTTKPFRDAGEVRFVGTELLLTNYVLTLTIITSDRIRTHPLAFLVNRSAA